MNLLLVNLPARRRAEYCLAAIDWYQAELDSGAILTITAERVRIRPGG